MECEEGEEEIAQMNKQKFFTSNPDLTRAGLGIVKIKGKLKELKK